MKAHTTVSFSHNLITNKFDLITYFGHSKREARVCPTTWETKDAAEKYLIGEQRDWLIQCLEDYIMHKKHIIEAGNGTEEQKKALTACLNFYNDIYTKALAIETICTRFIKGKAYFNAILPNQNNSSYAGSLNNLTELINFCEQHLKIVQ